MSIQDKIPSWCDKIIYWSIIAIPFVASFSSAAVKIFSWVMVFAFIVKKILAKNFSLAKTPINLPFMLIIGISILSIIHSVNIHSSLQGIVKLLNYGFLFIIMTGEIKDKKHFTRILYAIFLGLFLSSLDGIYQLVFKADFFRHKPYDIMIGLPRLKAAFPHTNIFAGYLALFVPVCIPLLRYYSSIFLSLKNEKQDSSSSGLRMTQKCAFCNWFDIENKKKLILLIITILGSFCLLFTFCRSAIIGVWFVILLMGILKKDKIVISLFVVSLLITPFLLPNTIKDWAKSTKSFGELLLNKERLVLYETSFNMIKHHPIIGVGVNTYVLNYQKYKLHDTSAETANTRWYAHNSYLQMAAEIGITGLLIFLYLLFKLFNGWRKFYIKTGDNFLKISSLGILMGIFAFLIHGLTETNLYYPKIVILFWFQVGLLGWIIFSKNYAR